MALTKLDVLDGFKALKICVGYQIDGNDAVIDYFRQMANCKQRVSRFTRKCRGGRSQLLGRSWAELPVNAVNYIRRLEKLTKLPVTVLSTGLERMTLF